MGIPHLKKKKKKKTLVNYFDSFTAELIQQPSVSKTSSSCSLSKATEFPEHLYRFWVTFLCSRNFFRYQADISPSRSKKSKPVSLEPVTTVTHSPDAYLVPKQPVKKNKYCRVKLIFHTPTQNSIGKRLSGIIAKHFSFQFSTIMSMLEINPQFVTSALQFAKLMW